jgi:hypothetical protein
MADWQAAQYWTRISGDATALQTMQLLGMIAVGVEYSGGSVVDADRSRLSQSEAYRVNYEIFCRKHPAEHIIESNVTETVP